MTTVPPEAQSRFLTAYSDRAFYRLHCTCWGIERVGPTAILLHGFMQNGREFDPLARRLALAGWRVFCPDFPGHGGTAWWHDGQYSPAAYASAVATTITAAGVPGCISSAARWAAASPCAWPPAAAFRCIRW